MLTGKDYEPGIFSRIFQGLVALPLSLIILPFALIYLYVMYVIQGKLGFNYPNFIAKNITKNGED